MWLAFENICWAVLFMIIGGVVGSALILTCAALLPKLIDRLTPSIDEDKEIARGNMAVAEYFGRVVAASIIGVSIVIAGAVVGGLISALH